MNATQFMRRFQCPRYHVEIGTVPGESLRLQCHQTLRRCSSRPLHGRIAPAVDQTERDPRDGLTRLFDKFA